MAIGSATITITPEIDWKSFVGSFSTEQLTRLVDAATDVINGRVADGVFL